MEAQDKVFVARNAEGFPIGLAQVVDTVVVEIASPEQHAIDEQAKLLQAVRADANKWRNMLEMLAEITDNSDTLPNVLTNGIEGVIDIDEHFELVLTISSDRTNVIAQICRKVKKQS